MELQLFSEAPTYDDVEELTLGDSLTDLDRSEGSALPGNSTEFRFD
jgi:hypothetical protein